MDPPTFKTRVVAFWEWYTDHAERILQAIDDRAFEDVLPEVQEAVNQLWPTFAWVFGPPREGCDGHSFTVSGEGILARQILADYWLSMAPELEGWTFYSARQPGDVDPAMKLRVHDTDFTYEGFWVSPTVDEDRELIDLVVWHPAFAEAEQNTREFVSFLMLDEILGEYGTDQWIGTIETSDTALRDAVPGPELREWVLALEKNKGWEKYPPPQSFSGYRMKNPDERFLRSDTIAGSTRCMRLLQDYFEAQGPFEEDLVEGSGAEFVFVSYPSDLAPKGEEVTFRAELEDLLEEALGNAKSGELMGGAVGFKHSYIDLVLFDGQRSMDVVADTLRNPRKLQNATLQFFVAGNEKRRIAI